MSDQPTLEELLEARIAVRKRAKSGNPAARALALRRLYAVERLIRQAKESS